jgi:hypothetical protein
MAIVTMTRLALGSERAPVAQEAGLEGVRVESATSSERVTSALDQIVAYVPSEVIGIYIAGVGIIGPASDRARWGLLVFSLLMIPAFIWLSDSIERRADPKTPKAASKLVWVCVLAGAAFVAWSAALPDTPFLKLSAKATQIGSFLAVVLSFLMPKVAAALGIAPNQ